jgi:uncharacterized membrane protein
VDLLLVEGIALVTAITNAVSALFISKGMRGSNALSAAIVSTSVQAGILTAILIVQLPSLNGMAVALFALSGVFALGVGRLLYFVAVGRIGLAVSSAVIGCNPLISALLAIVLLGERFVFAVFVGALLVVVGIFLLSGTTRRTAGGGALVIPFLSALSYSLANVIRKAALNYQPDPTLGAQIGAMAGSLCLLAYLIAAGRLGEIRVDRRGLGDGDRRGGDHDSLLLPPLQPPTELGVPEGGGRGEPQGDSRMRHDSGGRRRRDPVLIGLANRHIHPPLPRKHHLKLYNPSSPNSPQVAEEDIQAGEAEERLDQGDVLLRPPDGRGPRLYLRLPEDAGAAGEHLRSLQGL